MQGHQKKKKKKWESQVLHKLRDSSASGRCQSHCLTSTYSHFKNIVPIEAILDLNYTAPHCVITSQGKDQSGVIEVMFCLHGANTLEVRWGWGGATCSWPMTPNQLSTLWPVIRNLWDLTLNLNRKRNHWKNMFISHAQKLLCSDFIPISLSLSLFWTPAWSLS